MQITFTYFAQVRVAAGVETEELVLDDGTDVDAAVAALVKKHGDAFAGVVVDDSGSRRPSIIVLVNGVPSPHGASQALKDEDAVSILSPVAGG